MLIDIAFFLDERYLIQYRRMDVQTSSYGLRNVIASGPHSYVVADHPVHHRQHAYSLPPPSRPIVQAKPCYEIVQLVPTAVYIPVQEQKQKQNYSRPARGN